MNNVRFECDKKNRTMFELSYNNKMSTVPIVGDEIEFNVEHMVMATFRVRYGKSNWLPLVFVVVKRTYCLNSESWTLLCRPTSESLTDLLKNLKVK
jgi:hypothetical protein